MDDSRQRSLIFPGAPSRAQPGTASPTRLRARLRAGLGTLNAQAFQMQKLFRTQPEGQRPPPSNIHEPEDVTRHTPLEQDQAAKVHEILRQNLPLHEARLRISSILQGLRVDGDVRMEIRRRLLALYRHQEQGDVAMRHTMRKAVKGSQKPPKGSKGYNPVNQPGNAADEPAEAANGRDKGEDAQVKLKAKVNKDDSGHKIKFHDEVEADIPHDGDYTHHATEYAKHYGMLQAYKRHDPERAEAHRIAANTHAKIANSMRDVGQTAPKDEDGDGVLDLNSGGAGNGGPNQDVEGKPMPQKPDGKRNPPVADDQRDAARRAAGTKG